MATTTNYGWVTPDDTDLVKDGAAAIRTLGSSVDTSFVNLLGGTTGQVLTKASGTDLDFSFATPASGGMTLLSTTTLSGATTTISAIDQTFKHLLIVLNNVVTSADADFTILYNGTTGAAEYTQTIVRGNNTTLSGISGEVSKVILNKSTTETVQRYKLVGQIQILNYSEAISSYTFANVKCNNASGSFYSNVCFGRQSTTAISAMTFGLSSGTFSAGSVYLYGVK